MMKKNKPVPGAPPGPNKDMTPEERVIAAAAYLKHYRTLNAKQLARKKAERMEKIKREGITEYGGRCSCCGEDTYEFLTLEHINGRLGEIKRLTGKKAWERLRSLGWPKDNYTILCWNCNSAKGAFGECPHKHS